MGSAPRVLSATGADPDFGGADVRAMLAARGGSAPADPGVDPGAPVPSGDVALKVPKQVELRRGVRARSLRGKALTLRVVWSGASGDSSTATATVRAR